MPQIAQQDYLEVASKTGRDLFSDDAAMAQMVRCIERKTVFDTLLRDGLYKSTHRVLMVKHLGENEKEVHFLTGRTGDPASLYLNQTAVQYEGLSAIQLALDVKKGATILFGVALSSFTIDTEQYLTDDGTGYAVCVAGHLLAVEWSDNDKLAKIEVSEITFESLPEEDRPEDYVDITWEDAQKLIGAQAA